MESITVKPLSGTAVLSPGESASPHHQATSKAGPVVVTAALVNGLPARTSFHFTSWMSPPLMISTTLSVVSSDGTGLGAVTVCPAPPRRLRNCRAPCWNRATACKHAHRSRRTGWTCCRWVSIGLTPDHARRRPAACCPSTGYQPQPWTKGSPRRHSCCRQGRVPPGPGHWTVAVRAPVAQGSAEWALAAWALASCFRRGLGHCHRKRAA